MEIIKARKIGNFTSFGLQSLVRKVELELYLVLVDSLLQIFDYFFLNFLSLIESELGEVFFNDSSRYFLNLPPWEVFFDVFEVLFDDISHFFASHACFLVLFDGGLDNGADVVAVVISSFQIVDDILKGTDLRVDSFHFSADAAFI